MEKQSIKLAAVANVAEAVSTCTLAFRAIPALPPSGRESHRSEAKAILIRLVVQKYREQQNSKIAA